MPPSDSKSEVENEIQELIKETNVQKTKDTQKLLFRFLVFLTFCYFPIIIITESLFETVFYNFIVLHWGLILVIIYTIYLLFRIKSVKSHVLLDFINKEIKRFGLKAERGFKFYVQFILLNGISFLVLILIPLTNIFFSIPIIFQIIILIYVVISLFIPILWGSKKDKFIVKIKSKYYIQFNFRGKKIVGKDKISNIEIFMISNKLCFKWDKIGKKIITEISESKWMPKKGRSEILIFTPYLYLREFASVVNFKDQFLNLSLGIRDWDLLYNLEKLRNKKKFSESINLIDKFLKADQRDINLYVIKSEILSELIDRKIDVVKNKKELEITINVGLIKNPENLNLLFLKVAYFPERAKSTSSQLISIGASKSEAFKKLTKKSLYKKHIEKTFDSMHKALKDIRKEKNYNEFFEKLNEIKILRPKDLSLVVYKSEVLCDDLQKYEEAIEVLDEGIKLNSKNTHWFISKSRILCDFLEEYELALDAAEDGLRIDDQEPSLYVNKAMILSKMNKPNEAIDAINDALEIDENNENILLRKSNLQYEKGEYYQALEVINRSIKLKPEYLFSYDLKYEILEKLGDYEIALDVINKAIELDPNKVNLYINKSRILCDYLEKYEFALKAVEDGLRIDDQEPSLYINKAMILNNMNKLEEAIQTIDVANDLSKDNSLIIGKKGYLLQEAGRLNEAIDSFDRAIKINPEIHQNYILKTEVLIDLAKYDQALKVIESAIKLDENDPYSYSLKAKLLGKANNHKKALEIIEIALDLDPNDHSSYQIKAETLKFLGKYEEALDIIDNALNLEPDDPNSHCIKSNILNYLEDFENSLMQINLAIGLAPDDVYYYRTKAEVLRRAGRNEKALEVIENVIKMDPSDAESFQIKTLICNELDKFLDALNSIEMAIDLEPNIYNLYEIKADVLRNLYRYEDALKNVQKALELYPDSIFSFILKADILLQKKEYKEALKVIPFAIENINKSEFFYNTGFYLSVSYQLEADILYNLKGYTKALEAINLAIESDKSREENNLSKAFILVRLSEKDQSLKLMQDLIESSPDNCFFQYKYGYLLLIIKEYRAAIENFKKAEKKCLKDDLLYEIYIYTGKCHKILENFDLSREYLEKGKRLAEERNDELWINKANKYLSVVSKD